jgi:hypothetical protein
MQKDECGEPDSRSGIPTNWLCYDLLLWDLFDLAQNVVTKIGVGDDPALLRGSDGKKAFDRLLDHRLLTVEWK